MPSKHLLPKRLDTHCKSIVQRFGNVGSSPLYQGYVSQDSPQSLQIQSQFDRDDGRKGVNVLVPITIKSGRE
jgi:hypothetical protein